MSVIGVSSECYRNVIGMSSECHPCAASMTLPCAGRGLNVCSVILLTFWQF